MVVAVAVVTVVVMDHLDTTVDNEIIKIEEVSFQDVVVQSK